MMNQYGVWLTVVRDSLLGAMQHIEHVLSMAHCTWNRLVASADGSICGYQAAA